MTCSKLQRNDEVGFDENYELTGDGRKLEMLRMRWTKLLQIALRVSVQR